MTTEPEAADDMELETEIEEDGEGGAPVEGGAEDDGDEYAIEIDGEEEAEEDPLVKQLRKQTRDQARELAEYRKATAPKPVLGPEPTLEDTDYDEDRYRAALLKWHEDKRAVDDAAADEQRQAEIRNQEAQRRVVTYQQQMGTIPLPAAEKDAAHEAVVASLSHMHQAAVLNYCDNPAKIVLALAKHPAKLAQLAAEPDPIRFILKVKEIERNLKVVNRKKPPAPEGDSIQSGSASLSTGTDKELERLEKDAARTGDRSKVIRYNKSRKAA